MPLPDEVVSADEWVEVSAVECCVAIDDGGVSGNWLVETGDRNRPDGVDITAATFDVLSLRVI